MKKSLIVLLIAVLALSSAFAAITGSTTASYKVDFADKDNVKFTYAKPGTTGFDAEIELDYQAIQALGEGNAYVDFEAEATIDAGYGYNGLHSDAWKAANAFGVYDLDFSISKADIVAGKWTINLLKAKVGADYAQSAIDTKKIHADELEEAVVPYTYKLKFDDVVDVARTYDLWVLDPATPTSVEHIDSKDAYDALSADTVVLYDASKAATKLGNGITVSYDGFNLGLSFEKGTKSLFLLGLETKEFELDEFKFQAAVAFASAKDELTTNAFTASAKASYADNFTVAADFGFKEAALDFDLSANLTYDPLTVDFYYASEADVYDTIYPNGKVLSGKYYNVLDEDGEATDVYKDLNTKLNLMSVKGALDFASFDVPVKLTVTAKDILGANTLDVEASTTAVDGLDIAMYLKDALTTRKLGGKLAFTGFEGLTLSAEANYQLADNAEPGKIYEKDTVGYSEYVDDEAKDAKDVFAGTFWADFKAEYAAEKFTAKAEAEFRTVSDENVVDAKEALDFGFTASIESDKLVNGATLKLAYKYVPGTAADATYDATLRSLDEAGNAITASCKVVF